MISTGTFKNYRPLEAGLTHTTQEVEFLERFLNSGFPCRPTPPYCNKNIDAVLRFGEQFFIMKNFLDFIDFFLQLSYISNIHLKLMSFFLKLNEKKIL